MEHYHTTLPPSASRTSQSISKKPPPPHKRHTKPCKYYQLNQCPHPSDVCNFAHVLLPSPKEARKDTLCRFYTAGNCHSASQCRYRHPEDVPPPYKSEVLQVSIPESRAGWHGMSSPDKARVYVPGYPSPYYSPAPHDGSYANGISIQSPVYLPFYPISPPHSAPHIGMGIGSRDDRHLLNRYYPNYGPCMPTIGARPMSTSTSRSSRHSTTSTSATNFHFSFDELHQHDDGLSTGSSSSLSSESPSTESDELIIATTEDPKYPEHRHAHQSQVVVIDQSGPVHVPLPVFYPAVDDTTAVSYATQFKQQHQQQAYQRQTQRPQNVYYRTGTPVRHDVPTSTRVLDAASNTVLTTASRNFHRIKPSKYKTKPCKFFAMDGTCPAGDECTFRHNEPYPPLPLGIVSMKAYPNIKAPHATLPSQQTRDDIDQKNNCNYNNVKKEYFPLPWRVIGGGVRIGTKTSRVRGDSASTNHTNSDYSSESMLPSDSSDEDDDVAFEYVDSRHHESGGGVLPQSPSASAKTAAVPLPKFQTDLGTGGKTEVPTTRKRSNSIPLTPSLSQFIVGNLFSAESPGVL